MKRKSYLTMVLLLLLLTFGGCAMFAQTVDTPEKRALAILKTWNSQFDDTMAMAKMPNLSEEQKELVRTKKKWLGLLKPLVDLYVNVVKTEGTVPEVIERELKRMINQLIAGIEPSADAETQVQGLINQLVSRS